MDWNLIRDSVSNIRHLEVPGTNGCFTERTLPKLQNLIEPVKFGCFNNQISSQGSFEDECRRLSNKRSRAIHFPESSTEGGGNKRSSVGRNANNLPTSLQSGWTRYKAVWIVESGNSRALHPFERCKTKYTIYSNIFSKHRCVFYCHGQNVSLEFAGGHNTLNPLFPWEISLSLVYLWQVECRQVWLHC